MLPPARPLASHHEPAGNSPGLILTNETTRKVLAEQRQRDTEKHLLRAQEAGGMFVVRSGGTIEPTASFGRPYGVAPVERARSTLFEELAGDARIDPLMTDTGPPGGIDDRQVAEAARGLRPDLKALSITGCTKNAVLATAIPPCTVPGRS